MAKRIFVAATGQHCGKTTTSLALLHLARRKYRRIGFIKPFGAKPVRERGLWIDKDAALMAAVFGLGRDLSLMSPVVVGQDTTHRVVDGQLSVAELHERILCSFAELEGRCDFIVIEGSGHPGVGSVMKLSNARIASSLGAPVLLVTGAGLGRVVDDVELSMALFRQEHADVRALLVNKIMPEKRDRTVDYLQRALAEEPFVVLGGFDWEPVLSNPTMGRVASLLDVPIRGSRRHAARIIHHIMVGPASPRRVADLLKDDSLLIVASNRDEILVTLAHLYRTPDYRSRIAGLIIPGVLPLGSTTRRILDGSRIPYLRTKQHTTGELLRLIHEDVSKITARDTEKLDMVRSMADTFLDLDLIESACTSRTVPAPVPARPKAPRRTGPPDRPWS